MKSGAIYYGNISEIIVNFMKNDIPSSYILLVASLKQNVNQLTSTPYYSVLLRIT
jgi:hypothetical protein